MLRLPADLVEAIDKEATHSFVTRSAMMRQMLVAYLRPGPGALPQPVAAKEHEELYVDPDDLIKSLQRQKQLATVRALLRERKAKKKIDKKGGV